MSAVRLERYDPAVGQMFYEDTGSHGLRHNPWKALVVPRPIGWISTISASGVANIAPFSYFNAVADHPPIVIFAPNGPRPGGGHKDTLANILATNEFVVNMVTSELCERMNLTSAHFGPEIDEFAMAGLTPAPCRVVKPPRLLESPVNLECRFLHALRLPTTKPPMENNVVFGQVVGIHIADELIVDGMIDMQRYAPVARLGYMDYTRVDNVFALDRPDVAPTELLAEMFKSGPGAMPPTKR